MGKGYNFSTLFLILSLNSFTSLKCITMLIILRFQIELYFFWFWLLQFWPIKMNQLNYKNVNVDRRNWQHHYQLMINLKSSERCFQRCYQLVIQSKLPESVLLTLNRGTTEMRRIIFQGNFYSLLNRWWILASKTKSKHLKFSYFFLHRDIIFWKYE